MIFAREAIALLRELVDILREIRDAIRERNGTPLT